MSKTVISADRVYAMVVNLGYGTNKFDVEIDAPALRKAVQFNYLRPTRLAPSGHIYAAVTAYAVTPEGTDFIQRYENTLKENPIKAPWYWVGGAGIVVGIFAIWRWALNKEQTAIQTNLPPGVTLQTPSAADTFIIPKSRESVNLSRAQMPKFNLHFDNGSISFTPLTGVIAVEPTSFGATVTALAQGSAAITIVFGNDTTGLNDAIVGVSVFA